MLLAQAKFAGFEAKRSMHFVGVDDQITVLPVSHQRRYTGAWT